MSAPRSALFVLFCLSLTVLAQQPLPPGVASAGARGSAGQAEASPPPTSASQDRKIRLDVVVSEKKGKPVAGLEQRDFTVLDNKQPQKILSFHAIEQGTRDSPVEIILLIDAVNATYSNVAYERQSLEKFLKQNGGKLAQPVSLILFTDAGAQVQKEPSSDGNALSATLEQNVTGLRTIRRSQGFYGAADRLQLSLTTIGQLAAFEANRPGRKLLLWIGPGWPMLSGPGVVLSNKEEQGIFNSIVALSTGLRRARVTLYNVNPLGIEENMSWLFYYQSFLQGVTAPRMAQAGNLALQVLASQSGGLVLNSGSDLSRLIATCLEDTEAFYTLSFESPSPDQPNEYHAVDVKVDKSGLTARTRTGYYAQR